MSGLHFAFLTTFYPPFSFGGDGIAVQRHARALVRAGHRVTVIHDLDAWKLLADKERSPGVPSGDGVEVIGLRSGVGALSPLVTQQTGRPWFTGRRIAGLLAERRVDVIHYHNISLLGGPGAFTIGQGIKLYTAHEHWLVCPTHVLLRHRREPCPGRQCLECQLRYHRPPQWWRRDGVVTRNLDRIDRFLAMSEFSRRIHHEFGFPREMEVLPPFPPESAVEAETPDEASPHGRPYFLFAGRLEAIKGLQDVLPSFDGDGPVDLVVAGSGSQEQAWRQRAAGNPRVRFLGWLGERELGRWYRHAIAGIIPSRCYETFGMVMLEAFREATPVIVRRIGPLPEQVEQSGGGESFTTRAELEAAMHRLAGDRSRRDAMGRAGQDALRRLWSEDSVLTGYLEIVRSAATARQDTRVLQHLS